MGEVLTTTAALDLMDTGWDSFHRRVASIPTERLASRIAEDSWTLKQMLAHITAWHDLGVDQLGKFASSGEPPSFDEHEDVVNARAARAAEGRTIGEILLAMADSYRRLRREVSNLTDAQLAANDGWASELVDVYTRGHYELHMADLAAGR